MKFGGVVATRIDDWQIFQELEALGYDSAWAPDSQMIWSDCYATLALAAHHTSRIRLGTGVSIAGTRAAPVTAHSIATINKLAPGRTFLGIGTGHTAMRIMGQNPVPPSKFRDYLRVLSGLMKGDEVEYEGQPIRFLDRELECINTDDPIDIYVAANGPKALAAAGAYGTARIGAGNEPVSLFQRNMERMCKGAAEVGRTLSDDFPSAVLTYACILEPGEKLTSDRVKEEVGSAALSSLHFWYEIYLQRGTDTFIQPEVRETWDAYKAYVESEFPPERRHQYLHRGHCAFTPEDEHRFITPELIRASGGLVGDPDEIIEQIRVLEAGGLTETLLLPPVAVARDNFKSFAEQVMARY